MAVVAGCLAVGGPVACTPFARALGFGGAGSAGAPLEIRNGTDIGVNVYVLPRATQLLQPAFVGRVGARASRTFHIRGTAPGDTVWLRARPIDGRPDIARDDVVVGRDAVWRIP